MDQRRGDGGRPGSYVSPDRIERGSRALPELRNALKALRTDGWVQTREGWGLALQWSDTPGIRIPVTPFNLHQVDSGELELLGWTLTGALRAHCSDMLGNHFAEKYLAKILPAEVTAWNNHPHVDQVDAIRALQKAIGLASKEARLIELTERPARAAAVSPSPLRRARSASR